MHRFCALFAALLFALACPAGGTFASVMEFGPDDARFSVDVPAGWYVQEIEHGVSVTPDDSTAFIALTATRAHGDAQAEASALAKEMGIAAPREERPGIWTARGKVSGSPALCRVTVKEGFTYAATLLGRALPRLEAIAATFTPLAPRPAQAKPQAPSQAAPAAPAGQSGAAQGAQNGQNGQADRGRPQGPAVYGPSFHRFTAALPEGWTAQATESGLMASPPGGRTTCFLEMQANAEHLDCIELARAYARDSGLSQLADYPAGSREGRRCLKGQLEGEPALACVELRGRHYLGLVSAGSRDAPDRSLEAGLGLMDAVKDMPAR